MSRHFWLLLLLAPLLAGCGAGLKEEGRVPIMDPLGLSDGSSLTVVSRGGQVSAGYTGSFSNTSADIHVGDVSRFIISQRIQSAQISVPLGATLPDVVTLNGFSLSVTFSDDQGTERFSASAAGTVTLTHTTGNNYTVTIADSGQDQCLVVTLETGNLSTLAQIVTQGGDNRVDFTLTANVADGSGLPDGSRIIFTVGTGTGTLEL